MQRVGDFAVPLAVLALMVQLTISGNLLVWLGVSYDVDGGMLFEKIHPATYLLAIAAFARVASWWDSSGHAAHGVMRLKDLALFLACISFCLLYAAALTGAGGLITLIDSFLPAGMVGVALADAKPAQLVRLRYVLRALFFTNACLALGESAAGAELIPLRPDMSDPTIDFRPTALYDHPLTGAAATMLGLMLRSRGSNFGIVSICYDTIMFTALLAFGGRIALLVLVMASSTLFAARLAWLALHNRLRMRDLLWAAAASACCAALAAGAWAGGLADRLVAHLYWDPSAQARIDQLRILDRLSFEQIIFGIRRADLMSLIEPLRLSFRVAAIENFWLLIFLTLGALCFPVFLCAIAALVHFLWREGSTLGRLMIVTLLLVASTSNSLGRKSNLLTLLVGCVAASGRGCSCAAERPAPGSAGRPRHRFA
jgi:hypothetical protein